MNVRSIPGLVFNFSNQCQTKKEVHGAAEGPIVALFGQQVRSHEHAKRHAAHPGVDRLPVYSLGRLFASPKGAANEAERAAWRVQLDAGVPIFCCFSCF